jgi:uncharacterized heparinase superfamily protein
MIRDLLRRTGPRPVLVARFVTFKLQRRRLNRRLRRNYSGLVAEPPGTACLRLSALDIPRSSDLPEELRADADRLRAEAELVREHRMSLLGSGLVSLGPEIDWQRDFKSGYRWPASFYLDLEVTRLTDDSDAKVPWELSRCHHLLTLARAAALDGDERFAEELERQLVHWIDANPPGVGINWVNSMEIAIRAVNWIWAIRTLEAWRPLEPSVRAIVTESLRAHGRHIALNLEGSPLLRSNHYLSDILGLFALGSYLEDEPQSRRWRASAHRALEKQIRTQVLDDGVGFEASTAYHGLALEIFLLAHAIAAEAGMPFSRNYDRRLNAMLDVSAALRHPDGRIPLFGDSDSGRILPGGFDRPATHDPLLWLGAAIFDRPGPPATRPSPEVAWTLGVDAWRRLDARSAAPGTPSSAFPDGGLYVLRSRDSHVVVRCGDVGQNGAGGHAHNDAGSYELSSQGVPLVIDSGTYAYTADPDARDRFRSTRAHNSVVVDGAEVNPLPEGQPFQLPQFAHIAVEEWDETPSRVRLVVSHDGYRRLSGSPEHRRTFELDRETGELSVEDVVDGAETHLLESLLHLAPGTTVHVVSADEVEISKAAARIRILFSNAEVEIDEAWTSSEFGVRELTPLIVARCAGELPLSFGYTVVLRPRDDVPEEPTTAIATHT